MKKLLSILFIALLASHSEAQQLTRILFVFDASNSMNGKWEGATKIDHARRIFASTISELEGVPNLEVALRVYGHQSPITPTFQDCNDTKLEVPFGPNNFAAVKGFINTVECKGTTPIARSLEAAADALRMELSPWRIPVVLIEPAQTDTDMWRTAGSMVDDVDAALTPAERDLYGRHVSGMRKAVPISQRLAVAPEKVSDVVRAALTAKRPRARYIVGAGPRLQIALMTNLPVRVRDRVLRAVMRQP